MLINQSTSSNTESIKTENPYSKSLFSHKKMNCSVSDIIKNTLDELDTTNYSKINKKNMVSLSEFLDNYFNLIKNGKEILEAHSPKEEENISVQQINKEEIEPIVYPELPKGPDPSLITEMPPEKCMLPPKLWGRVLNESSKQDLEETPNSPIQKRKRGRPRKNADPNEYMPKYGYQKQKKIPKENEMPIISRSATPKPIENSDTKTLEASVENEQSEDEPNIEISENNISPYNVNEIFKTFESRNPKVPLVEIPESEIDEICGLKNSEYLVKLKGKSYRELEWMKKDKIFEYENGKQVLDCFQKIGIPTREPFYNPLFTEIERILDIKDSKYLVKWKSLGYKYCTWIDHIDDNCHDLIKEYKEMINPPQPKNITSIEDVNVLNQFSLDEPQNKVVEELLHKYSEHKSVVLYGNIGSILRLEVAVLFFVIRERFLIPGPHVLVVSPSIYELAINEMSVYTEFTVLGIPDDDEEEFEKIKEYAFITNDNVSKFNILVISSTMFSKFKEKFPSIHYNIVVVDHSEIYGDNPSISSIDANMKIVIHKRKEEEYEIDSQDDSTLLHDELTIFCPMNKTQEDLYNSVLLENLDMATQSPETVDNSRLYDIFLKLNAIANCPSILNSQDINIARGNKTYSLEKKFNDCGKLRVLTELISYAQKTNKRLMVLCRDTTIYDILESYTNNFGIPHVNISPLGTKRVKLEDLLPEAKSNKKIIVLAQSDSNPINWLSLILDIIVSFDGVYNPMYYFTHAQRKPKKRNCLYIRLLSANTHESYLGAAAEHYQDLPLFDIFKAALNNFARPIRESIINQTKYLKNNKFDKEFASEGIRFQYLFDEESQESKEFSQEVSSKKVEPIKKIQKIPEQSSEIISEEKALVKQEPPNNKIHHHLQYHLKRKYRIEPGKKIEQPIHGRINIHRHKHYRKLQFEQNNNDASNETENL